MDKVAIIGYGFVGKAYHKVFPDAVIYDEPLNVGNREEANNCDLAIICVPTPSKEDGSCDTSIVQDVVSWLQTPVILIKSAVVPGTTDFLKAKYGKRIVISPEYAGESKYWIPPRYPDPTNPLSHGFIILGGDDKDCSEIADIFIPRVGPATRFRFVKAREAELIKYAENAWAGMKVTFANELYQICETLDVNWHQVREGWLDDPRVEPMHTAVFKNKLGFGGKCLPKDIKALISMVKEYGYEPILLEAMIKANEETLKYN